MTTFVLYSAVLGLTPSDLSAIAAACVPALADVVRAWSPYYPEIVPPSVRLASGVTDFADGEVPVLFVASLDQPRDLAYHYIRDGHPYALVLADSFQSLASIQQGAWHEMAEALVDPDCSRYVGGLALEVCDPVQSDAVLVGGITLSPFVLPSWFGLGGTSAPFDSAGLLAGPGAVHAGGYAMREDGSEVHAMGYEHGPAKRHPSSRRMRRLRAIAAKSEKFHTWPSLP